MDAGGKLLALVLFDGADNQHLAALSSSGKLLVFPLIR